MKEKIVSGKNPPEKAFPLFPLIVSVCLSFFFLTPLHGEPLILDMEISPNPVGRGDSTTLTILLDYPDTAQVDAGVPELPKGIRLFRGPFIRTLFYNDPDGSTRRVTEISYTLRGDQAGRFVLPGFPVTAAGRVIESPATLLRVGVWVNRVLQIPYELEWFTARDRVYAGEAVPLVLMVQNLEEIFLFEEIAVTPPGDGFFEPADEIGSIREHSAGSVELYDLPLREYIFTPSRPGRVAIPAAQAVSMGIRGSSAPLNLEVLPLPEVVETTGAVGVFSFDYRTDDGSIFFGQDIRVRIRAEGEGNLNYLQLPVPVLGGNPGILVDEKASFIPSPAGYKGFREAVFSFIPESDGWNTIIVPPFPFIDPETGRASPGREGRLNIEVVQQSGEGNGGEEVYGFPFSPLPLPVRQGAGYAGLHKEWTSYLWMLPGPLLFLAFFLVGRKKKSAASLLIVPLLFLLISAGGKLVIDGSEVIDSGISAFSEEQYGEALEFFQEGLRLHPENPKLLYNTALGYYKTGSTGRAVFSLRQAIEMEPSNRQYRDFLEYMELKEGLSSNVMAIFPLHPDILFLCIMIGINLTGFLGVFYLLGKSNLFFILTVLMLFMTTSGFFVFGYAVWTRSVSIGVIMEEESRIKRIPRADASDAFTLPEGETVIIKGDSEGFFFIHTASELKGWLRHGNIELIR